MKKTRIKTTIRAAAAAALAAMLLAGCASNAEFLQSQRDIEPAEWSARMPRLAAASLEQNAHWWQAWDNPELNGLLEAAARATTDVLTAVANLRNAAALADKATADLFPSLSAGMNASGQRRSTGDTTESWGLEGSAAWSFSLAGGNIAARRAAKLEAMASAMTLEDTRIMVASEVAQTYVNHSEKCVLYVLIKKLFSSTSM